MALSDLLNFNLPNSRFIIGAVIVLLFICFLIWRMIRESNLESGTWGERSAIRGLGYSFGLSGFSGRGLLNTFRRGIRGSLKLAALSVKAGKKGGKIAKSFAKYASKLVKGEERNIEEALHQTAAAASSLKEATIAIRSAKEQIGDEQRKSAIMSHINELDSQLASLISVNHIDDAAKESVSKVAQEIMADLIELANDEEHEVLMRKLAFKQSYSTLKVVRRAERLSRRIESKAIFNQNALIRFNNIELREIERYLENKLKEERRKLDEANKALSNTTDAATKDALEKQIQISEQVLAQTKANVDRILASLQQLRTINKRMRFVFVKVRKNIKNVLSLLRIAISKEKKFGKAEKYVENEAKEIKNYSKKLKSTIRSMRKLTAEEILISLVESAGKIFNGIGRISQLIIEINNKHINPFLDSLRNAMNEAYKVEESTRLTNRYYEQIMRANQEFYQLVFSSDLSQELKQTFMQELQYEKLEESFAAQEESAMQASKSLFIRAVNVIEQAMSLIPYHNGYLDQMLAYAETLKRDVISRASQLMEVIGKNKIRANSVLKENAEQYQARLAQEVQKTQKLARIAA